MNEKAIQAAQASYLGWKGWGDSDAFGRCDRAASAYFRAELEASRVRLNAETRVLELGFGNGEFLGFCREHRVHYIGTEIDPSLIEAARKSGCRALEAGSALTSLFEEGARFDLVVAFDVFEHVDIELLVQSLKQICKILKPKGKLLFRIPSGDSPFACAIQHGDLTHRTILGSSALVQLARISGLQPVQIREPVLIYQGLSFMSLVRRFAIQSLRKLSFSLMKAAYFSGANVVLTQNLVACFELTDQRNE